MRAWVGRMAWLRPVILLALALGCLVPGQVRAANDPDLFLRIETGEHEADINRVIRIPGTETVLSVSDDKTARLWSIDDLAPRGILRPPIGPLDDGALYAAAATAQRIALAGRTSDRNGHFAVHLFAVAGLRPLGSIAGLGAPIMAMKFSPDGNVLVIGLEDRFGVRAFDIRSGAELRLEEGYEGSITAMDFAADGRLAVAAADGKVRLYAPDLHRIAVVPLPGAGRPWGVAFSPDGKLLAVGDRLRPMVHVLDGAGLRVLTTLDGTAPQRQGSFNVVAFGADGLLYAAGSYKDAAGGRLMRAWSADWRMRLEAKLATDTVTDLLPTAAGVVFASAEPSLGWVDAAGQVRAERRGRHMELRDVSDRLFRLSADGNRIDLPAGPSGAAMVFDARARELRPPIPGATASGGSSSGTAAGLAPALARDGGTAVTDWKNTPSPKINGVPVKLEPSETSRSAAVSHAGPAAALGTDFYVRFYVQGREAWRAVAPAPVWAVNISADGSKVVAGLGNGSVVWYSAGSGEELMSLFIDPASGRWVMWTPEGFFAHDQRSDGQPDGRTLIGYRRNAQDRRSSVFVEIGQLYPVFFRPDLVGLSLRDTAEARQTVADQRERLGDVSTILARGLPPAVAVLDSCGHEAGGLASGCPPVRTLDTPAADGSPMRTAGDVLLVNYRLQQRDGELGHAVIRRNDAVISPSLFVSEEAPRMRVEEATIPLGEGLNVIRITPVSATGQVEASAAESKEIRVFRVASTARSAEAPHAGGAVAVRKPVVRPKVTLHVLSVGVGTFQRSELNLANAVSDARSVAKLMETATPPVDDNTDVILLTDADATTDKILAALHTIAEKALPDDLVLIFLAGHGQQVDGRYYFAPVDFGTRDENLYRRALSGASSGGDRALDELFRHEGLGQDRLLPAIQAIQASRVAMILDTCFSASIATQDAVLRRDLNTTVTNTLGHAAGRFVLSSSSALALDSAGSAADLPRDAEGHGLFTSYMLRALNGEADFDKAGHIDIYKLATFTTRAVEQATADLRQPQQPAFFFAGSQFFDLRAVPVKP